MGATFKENTPDTRNSRAFEIASELEKYGISVDIFDPIADKEVVKKEYGRELKEKLGLESYDAAIIVIPHKDFISMGAKGIKKFLRPNNVVYDVKSIFSFEESDLRL